MNEEARKDYMEFSRRTEQHHNERKDKMISKKSGKGVQFKIPKKEEEIIEESIQG